MNDPRLHLELLRGRAPEIDRAARQLGPLLADRDPRPDAHVGAPVTVRFAAPDDARDVRRLADLDSSPAPAAPLLIGERAGRPVAALSLGDGAIIADPFVLTADVVALLQLRAAQLRRAAPRRSGRARRAIRWRVVRAGG